MLDPCTLITVMNAFAVTLAKGRDVDEIEALGAAFDLLSDMLITIALMKRKCENKREICNKKREKCGEKPGKPDKSDKTDDDIAYSEALHEKIREQELFELFEAFKNGYGRRGD